MTNKKWLIACAFLLISLSGCKTDNKQGIESGENLNLFVATDIHYLASDLRDDGEAFQKYLSSSDGKLLGYISKITDAFMDEVIQKKPDVLIISGDLTNNGEKDSHMKLTEKLKEVEKSAGTRIYVIPGNHDILNPWARGFQGTEQYITDTIDANGFESIYSEFGYDEAISRDKSSLSYLAAPSDDLWLLMLDTSIYDFNDLMGSPTTNGMIDPDTFEWIKQCSKLAKENHAQVITVMHHNLFNHSEVLNSGFTLDNSDEALEVFKNCDFNLVLSGHVHIQDIKSNEDQNPIYDIATSSLGVYPFQYGVINYMASDGIDYSTTRLDIEKWAKENKIEDENLINFNQYAKDYALKVSYDKAYESLNEADNLSEQDKKLMAETMSLLNIHYFAGTTDAMKEEIENSQGYKLWVDSEEAGFLKNYILSMLTDNNINNNQLNISNIK